MWQIAFLSLRVFFGLCGDLGYGKIIDPIIAYLSIVFILAS